METSDNLVTTEQKEATAITVMRCILIRFAEEKFMSFEDALLNFAKSKTYEDLFDYDTAVWKEGPDYLRCLYEEELA